MKVFKINAVNDKCKEFEIEINIKKNEIIKISRDKRRDDKYGVLLMVPSLRR